jgi:acetyltransferase-like isoleucine patch superfamily enzyme
MLRTNGQIWRLIDPILLKIASRLKHLERISTPEYASQWRELVNFHPTVHFFSDTNLMNYGPQNNLEIGKHSCIRGELSVQSPTGQIKIGHHSFVGAGTRIWAQSLIEIGNYVLISHLVDIHDSNSHSIYADLRREDPINLFEKNEPVNWSNVEARPVRIEDDVWIGFKSSIFKGVTVGQGAIVAACSVVRHDVPPYTLVAGNPAKVIRELEREPVSST